MKLEIDIPNIIYNDAKENRGYISVGKMEIAWKAIADGKPLEQAPKRGHWIEVLGGCKCSRCDMAFSKLKETCADNYCPNCGADMESEEV